MAEVEQEIPGTDQKGGVAADHPLSEPLRALVAPSTGEGFNTLGERLIPKGCFRLEDVLFEFDSSFVRPDVKAAMPELRDLRERHKQGDVFPPLSIFGHGDPVGNEDYNKRLSGRRAQAIYGMLIRDEALWEDLFSHPAGGDDWGNPAVVTMLDALGHAAESGKQADSVRSFQSEQGLTVDGIAGPKTRKALFRAYMDFLCGPDLVLDKEKDFLGRHGDPDGKADFQGCGEFNPIRMFSKEENDRFQKVPDKTERNHENAPNRRVMILLFAPGRRVNPAVWPCPRAKEGVTGCKKRFFPDADKRRSFQEQRREFDKTKDTFACRFYQLISDDSPCDRFQILTTLTIRLFDVFNQPIASAPYELTIGSETRKGKARSDGFLEERTVEVPVRCSIRWGFPTGKAGLEFVIELFLDVGSDEEEQGKRRFHNLGYRVDLDAALADQGDVVREFQRDYRARFGLVESGELDPPTKDALRQVHDTCDPDPNVARS
jgi:outer membrane protein OmpA-like peptidoglycan-associated protein